MKKTLFVLALVLSLKGQCQNLNLSLTGTYPGRAELGMKISDTVSPRSDWYISTGIGWLQGPYPYLGAGLDLQMVRNLDLNAELFPVISTEHRNEGDRGNRMVGDELMLGARVRVGPKYSIQLLSSLDLVLVSGVELLCPIFATRNAAAELKVQGYVGLELILHNL